MVFINKIMNNYFTLKLPKVVCKNIIAAKLVKITNYDFDTKILINKSLNSIFDKKFYGLALDFDGTMIPIEKRYNITERDILIKLKKLNEAKIPIFILTGRGSSIFDQLPIDFFNFRDLIFFAQYNGGQIIQGKDKILHKHQIKNSPEYSDIKSLLVENKISFEEKTSSFVVLENMKSYPVVKSYIDNFDNWKVVNTGNSFDILPVDISKKFALEFLCKSHGIVNSDLILKVGDAGDKDGNDYDFLELKNSFSVGNYSSNKETNFPVINQRKKILKGPKGLKFLLKNIDILL